MPSGHPKDPVAYRQRMLEAKQRRDEKKAADTTRARELSLQGVSHADVAAEMGISESSVRGLLSPPRQHGTRKHTAKKVTARKRTRKETIEIGKEKRVIDEALAALREKLTGDNPNGPLVPPNGGPFPRVTVDEAAELFPIEESTVYKDLKTDYEEMQNLRWKAEERADLAERRLAILFDLIGGNTAQYRMNDLSQLR